MNKKKVLIRIVLGLYVFMGLLVATQGGLTLETLRKIMTQEVTDQILEVKKVYKNKMNEIMICYSAYRTNDFRGLGKEDEIENWLIIPVEEWKSGDRWPSFKVSAENSYFQGCSEFPSNTNEGVHLAIQTVENKIFNAFFSYKYPEYDELTEKLYVTAQDRYLKIGYVNNFSNDVIAFKIFAPDIIIEGDSKQILFLPFALLADVISWPIKLNNFFNSKLSI